MRVSHVWFTDHSICYIELGALSPGRTLPNGLIGNAFGEATVFLGYEWLAKTEGARLSRHELHRNVNERDALVAKMVGQTVEFACLIEPDLEIEIGISTGVTLISASSGDEDPDWDVGFNNYRDGSLCIENGKLRFLP